MTNRNSYEEKPKPPVAKLHPCPITPTRTSNIGYERPTDYVGEPSWAVSMEDRTAQEEDARASWKEENLGLVKRTVNQEGRTKG
jgi:hypothetical protein